MGHDHVEEGSGVVVEAGPVGDAERLRTVDLHRAHASPVPHPGEQAVGEAQDVQVLRRLLAEEVVDPVHLRLVEHGVDDLVERAERLARGAERLLVHDPRTLGQLPVADAARHRREPAGRDRQVVDQLRRRAEVTAGLLDHREQRAVAAVGEVATLSEADFLYNLCGFPNEQLY